MNDYDDSIEYRYIDELYNNYKAYVYDNTNSKKVSKEKFKESLCELLDVKLKRSTDDEGKRKWEVIPKEVNTKSKK